MHEHHVHPVSRSLAPFVRHAVGYRHDGAAPGVHVGMPSSTLTLVLPLDEPLVVSSPSAAPRAYASVVAGLHTAPAHIHHEGREHGIHLELTPRGARALLGLPAGELAERSVELADLLGPRAMSLRDELHSTPGWVARFAAVERELCAAAGSWRQDATDREPRPEVAHAWQLLVGSGGRARVGDVAREVGWSRRHLEHRFRSEFGLRPKTVARLARFERSVAAARDVRRSLAAVAADCGYADQAHLARDWRDLAGLPPSRWRAEDELAFVQDERQPVGEA